MRICKRLARGTVYFTAMHDPALHLFVDDHHIRNAFCLKRVFYPLEQDHKACLVDGEGRYLGWACVMREEGKFRCWYH